MSARFWRRLCYVLGALCVYQAWSSFTRTPSDAHAKLAAVDPCGSGPRLADDRDSEPPPHPTATATGGSGAAANRLYGFQIPKWAAWFAPQPGEDWLSYRDRVVPVARAAIAPQRERVARMRDDFANAAHLDPGQLALLDTTTKQTADAIETRVLDAVMNGDFSPDTIRPMAGVQLARDVLDDVVQSDQRFRASLRDDQRATLAQQPFDFADYMAFSTKWEQALGYAE